MNENMRTGEAGRAIIKKWEGLHDGNVRTSLIEPMWDPVGIPTIGWGCTSYADGTRVKIDDKAITLEQCEELFEYHLKRAEKVVKDYVKVELTQNQFDALVSFVFNVGHGKKDLKDGFAVLKNGNPSTMLRKLNEKCYFCAADQFKEWTKSQGKFYQGLLNRRYEEKMLFLS